MIRRSPFVYGLLALVWVAIVGWQAIEHKRLTEAARQTLVYRARDITSTLGLVIRSQRRFGSIVTQERLEPALKELVKGDEVESISLLNAAGEVVASAGANVDFDPQTATRVGESWGSHSVTLVNLVDLGTNSTQEGEGSRPIIVLPKRDPDATNSEPRPGGRFGWWPGGPGGSNFNVLSNRARPTASPREGELSAGEPARRRPGRPPWMSEQEYQSLQQKQGVHSFVVVLSTQALDANGIRDLWLRSMIGVFGAVAAGGLALAWRNVAKSSDLQIRLLRASELNSHLKEMNIAAAGLAHETRNPLNIIRGLAQLISKQTDITPEIRNKSLDITTEVDRVTAQLNEFINYSKPREVRRAPVNPNAVAGDVVRALGCDLEEKSIELTSSKADFWIEADEQLLRQALFNLVMNAIQSVEVRGKITIHAGRAEEGSAFLEIRDDGPGISASQRSEIFKPYFTTRENGTGLGLAVVQQIVLAHGWDILCLPNEPTGAVFRLSHIRWLPASGE